MHLMDTRRINKLVMFLTVTKFCLDAKNAVAVNHLPAFGVSWNSFHAVVQKLRRRSAAILKLNPAGSAEDNERVRESSGSRRRRSVPGWSLGRKWTAISNWRPVRMSPNR